LVDLLLRDIVVEAVVIGGCVEADALAVNVKRRLNPVAPFQPEVRISQLIGLRAGMRPVREQLFG
jgi:hypothetical protein